MSKTIDDNGDVVTPWDIKSSDNGIDYDKLITKFGCEAITVDQIARLERIIKRPAHPFLRRGLFFAHRDFDQILDYAEKKIPFYLYTGRGPSNESLHIGHMIPFIFNQWLQEVFDVPLVIQITDDEKFLFKQQLTQEQVAKMCEDNIKDILAFGFDLSKTFIFSNIKQIGLLYPTVLSVEKRVTLNQARGIFGFGDSSNIGMVSFPAIQAAPAFPSCFEQMFGPVSLTKRMRCLIPCAIDQDPYFRMTRDIAQKMGFNKPSLLLSKFIMSLQGPKGKMSSSLVDTAIYVNDTADKIKKKINRYAFSGGQATAEDQARLGADLSIDVSYQYLRFFLQDDSELERIGEAYASGKMMTGEIKKILISTLTEITQKHQERRSKITDDVMKYAQDPSRPDLIEAITQKLKTVKSS